MKITAIALSAAVLLSPVAAMADDAAPAPAPIQKQQTALAPGSAAGVQQAQGWHDNTWTYVAVGAVVAGGVIWAVSSNGNGHHSAPTTGTSP